MLGILKSFYTNFYSENNFYCSEPLESSKRKCTELVCTMLLYRQTLFTCPGVCFTTLGTILLFQVMGFKFRSSSFWLYCSSETTVYIRQTKEDICQHTEGQVITRGKREGRSESGRHKRKANPNYAYFLALKLNLYIHCTLKIQVSHDFSRTCFVS